MSVFHSEKFARLHNLVSFKADYVSLSLSIDNNTIGTYGGFSSANLNQMEAICTMLPRCEIKLAPAGHDNELFAMSVNVLSRNGFKVVRADLNYERLVVGEFEDQVSKGNRKVLRHSTLIKFATSIEEAYRVISDDRASKGLVLSMSLEDIYAMDKVSPWQVFGVGDNRVRAAALCLQVRPDILYVYAWGGEKENSPTVKLAKYIYEWCQLNGIRLMDIGTSTVDGVPDYGLINFKRSLGFRESLKLTMSNAYA